MMSKDFNGFFGMLLRFIIDVILDEIFNGISEIFDGISMSITHLFHCINICRVSQTV